MATRLIAIVGSVTPPGRLLNATRWLLDSARASRQELEIELINLADKKVAFVIVRREIAARERHPSAAGRIAG